MMGSGRDRRLAERHPVILDVTMNLGGAAPVLQGRSVDVSRSGIFIMTEANVPEGRRVDLLIRGEADELPVVTSGTVVHIVPKLGIGIRFSTQTELTRKRLDQFIDSFYDRKADLQDITDRDEPSLRVMAELTRGREKSGPGPKQKQ